MPKVLGVDFVPMHVPLGRRLQTFAVIMFSSLFIFLPLLLIYFGWLLAFTPFAWVLPTYGAWFLYDLNTSKRGSRPVSWIRGMPLLHWFRQYFPVSLVKTAELPADRNYIFGYHPHGILAVGAFANFATDATGFKTLFPGITPHLVTLVGQFRFPLRRELIMALGAIESSRESIDWVITHPDKGRAAVIVVGGASEILNARPGDYQILMSRRKGFIRMALQRGADLVPVYSFGENDIYKQATGKLYHKFETFLKSFMGYPVPIIYGRGILNYTFGFMPFRLPITTVVGAPIPVERQTSPSDAAVTALHGLYCERLVEIFEAHKARHGVPEGTHLEFV